MKFFVFVSHGMMLPRGYGVAWRDFARDGSVCAPIPLNRIIYLSRLSYLWLRFPKVGGLETYEYGYQRGWDDALDYGLYQRAL